MNASPWPAANENSPPNRQRATSGHDLIVVGASAGGVEALRSLVGSLPSTLPAAICVVLHIPAEVPSLLPVILRRAGPLPAFHAENGDLLQAGRIYIAPPDHHLLVGAGSLRVVRGPRENRCRPAADPLFRTAAVHYGPRVIGVVLSGALDDGTAGLRAIKSRGGLAVVQDPREATYPGMPRSALENAAVDHCVPLAEMGALLTRLAGTPAAPDADFPVPSALAIEARIAAQEMGRMEDNQILGEPSTFSCPECHGTLWEILDSDLIRFRCRVGHAYSVESMLSQQSESLEAALWTALRSLEESAELARRLDRQARTRHNEQTADRFAGRAQEREQHAAVLREVLRTTNSALTAE